MAFNVVLTSDAEEDLEQIVQYLVYEMQSKQAASNVLADFESTIKRLENVADSFKLCDNLKLRNLGYRRINFSAHRYFCMYRIVGKTVFVDKIFHELQDYENKMI